jgi:nitronate monooxygenase
MGGGPSTPELVAAVSAAGGFGWVGAAYMTPEQILDHAARVRALTDRPFGINLFAGAWNRQAGGASEPMLSLLAEVHEALGIDPPQRAAAPTDPFPLQLEAVLDVRPAMFSFTFGLPRSEDLDRLRQAGIPVVGTATTVREARLLAEAGVEAVIAQGAEAGAHRGTFAGAFEQAMVPTLDLVRDVAGMGLPVIAAGGLMDGADVAAALAAGAEAAALGTAFLVCPESGAAAAHKAAVLSAVPGQTVVTRAFSGRPARGLPNRFVREVQVRQIEIPPYPLQNLMTRPMRAAAAARGAADYLSLWAGTGAHRARALPAAELLRLLETERQGAEAAPDARVEAGVQA